MNKKFQATTEEGYRFGNVGPSRDNQYLFTINPGIDIAATLEELSMRLDSISEVLHDAGMQERPLQGPNAWLAHYAVEGIAAALMSIAAGLDRLQRAEK